MIDLLPPLVEEKEMVYPGEQSDLNIIYIYVYMYQYLANRQMMNITETTYKLQKLSNKKINHTNYTYKYVYIHNIHVPTSLSSNIRAVNSC